MYDEAIDVKDAEEVDSGGDSSSSDSSSMDNDSSRDLRTPSAKQRKLLVGSNYLRAVPSGGVGERVPRAIRANRTFRVRVFATYQRDRIRDPRNCVYYLSSVGAGRLLLLSAYGEITPETFRPAVRYVFGRWHHRGGVSDKFERATLTALKRVCRCPAVRGGGPGRDFGPWTTTKR